MDALETSVNEEKWNEQVLEGLNKMITADQRIARSPGRDGPDVESDEDGWDGEDVDGRWLLVSVLVLLVWLVLLQEERERDGERELISVVFY